jgi:hypothetical protein
MTSSVGIAPFSGLALAPKFSADANAATPMETVTMVPQAKDATLNSKQPLAVAPHSGQTAASQLTDTERFVGSAAGAAMDLMQRLTSLTGNNKPVSPRQTGANRSFSAIA